MNRWPWRRHHVGTPDPEAFLAELAAAHPGKSYNKSIDRYRDFRRLFLDSEQGRRVLYEILSWGHVFRCPAAMSNFDPYETMYHNGEANIAKQLMATMNAEPKARPASTKEAQHGKTRRT